MKEGKVYNGCFVSRESNLGEVYGLAHWDVSEYILKYVLDCLCMSHKLTTLHQTEDLEQGFHSSREVSEYMGSAQVRITIVELSTIWE